jgi:hypothetical protein
MNTQSLLLVSALFMVASASQASTTLVTFDDISTPGNNGPVPDSYKGLTWINLDYVDPFHHGGDWAQSGAGNGIVTLPYDVISKPGLPAEIKSETPFTLNSAYFAANWKDGLQVTVKGEFEGAITHTQTFIVNTSGSTREFFNWQNIDTVLITAAGGVHNTSLSGNDTSFAIDNLIINGPVSPAPEPETYAMLLAGLGLVGFIARRRKQTS